MCLEKEQFYKRVMEKFNNNYEYFDDYTGLLYEIIVKCNIHNIEFRITAKNHERSATGSCPSCSLEYKKEIRKNIKVITNKPDKDLFIRRAKEQYGNLYDYTNINFVSRKDQIKIKCIKHSIIFDVTPKWHLESGYGGCESCKNDALVKNIIAKCHELFGDKYNYSNLIKGGKGKQTITCNLCNTIFRQYISEHLYMKNCRGCEKIKNNKVKELQNSIERTINMRSTLKADEILSPIKVLGLENYFISSYGRIFRKDLKIECFGHKNKQGYIFVRLINTNLKKQILYRVHRLMGETFLPKIKTKNVIDHIDRVRDNNHISNLRWATQKENCSNLSDAKERTYIDNTINNDEIFSIITNSIYGSFPNYAISNYGKILNIQSQHLLNLGINDEGYVYFSLTNSNIKRINITVHRLVCEIFNSTPPDINLKVNHLDENGSNNYYKNLEWATIAENNKYSKAKKVSMLDDNFQVIKDLSCNRTNLYMV